MSDTDADIRHSNPFWRRAVATRLGLVAALLAAVALVAGCGGSSSNNNTSASGGSGSSGGGSGTVKAANINGYGQALQTSSGASVYLLSSDPPNQSKCAGSCAKTWIPVTVSGSASAGAGLDSSMISTFKRSDGKTQVAYNKHALYTYTVPGATSGEGVASNGGVWYLVSAKGDPIKKSVSGSGY